MVRSFALVALLTIAAAPVPGGKVEFERAVRYYKAEEFQAALPLFEKAYELSKHRPSAILGLAQCERALKLYDRALEHFNEYLATNPKPSEAAIVRKTIDLIKDLASDVPPIPPKEEKKEPPAVEQPKPKVEEPRPKVEEAKPPPPQIVPPQEQPAQAVKEEQQGTIFSSPIFWAVTAGAVVLVGGTVALVASQSGKTDPPYTGTTGLFFKP